MLLVGRRLLEDGVAHDELRGDHALLRLVLVQIMVLKAGGRIGLRQKNRIRGSVP